MPAYLKEHLCLFTIKNGQEKNWKEEGRHAKEHRQHDGGRPGEDHHDQEEGGAGQEREEDHRQAEEQERRDGEKWESGEVADHFENRWKFGVLIVRG